MHRADGVARPRSRLAAAGSCTSVFAWALIRPVMEPVYRTVLIRGFSAFGLLFGGWHVGLL